MAKPKKITDLQDREARIQLSQDKHLVDLYLGPEKIIRRSATRCIWAAHRVYDRKNFEKFVQRANQILKMLR